VVKAFNTTFAQTLVAGTVAGQPLDVFIAGDDAAAKATISQLVEAGGLHAIDVGPLSRARQLEGIGLLGITLQGPLGTQFMSAWKLLFP
jgi:predicted dinucleotide-binding enzyme